MSDDIGLTKIRGCYRCGFAVYTRVCDQPVPSCPTREICDRRLRYSELLDTHWPTLDLFGGTVMPSAWTRVAREVGERIERGPMGIEDFDEGTCDWLPKWLVKACEDMLPTAWEDEDIAEEKIVRIVRVIRQIMDDPVALALAETRGWSPKLLE